MNKYKKGAFVHIIDPRPLDWEHQFQLIDSLPLREHVEMWVEYIPTREEKGILRDMVKGREAIIHGPFIHMSLVSHLDNLAEISLRRCNEAIELATFLGAKLVTLHAGTYPIFDSRESAFERLGRRFFEIAKLKSPIICLENMPVRGGTVKECLGRLDDLRAFKSIIPDIHFTLDIGHCLQNRDDFEMFLREESSCIENIHLHDGNAGGRSHLPIGTGSLNLQELLDLFTSVPFTKYVGLETISFEDTKSSWKLWLEAEQRK